MNAVLITLRRDGDHERSDRDYERATVVMKG
jgi:hypothetical protein